MSGIRAKTQQRGFTLIELLTALGIFLLVCGAAFTLLASSQQRYQTESQVLTSFQEARLALDQIVRDVNDSGYPPPTYTDGVSTDFASTPFAWSPNYVTFTPCAIGSTCSTPADFDLIVETTPNRQDPNCAPNPCKVQWIRYQLQGTTLSRAAVFKAASTDPATATSGNFVPFVQNVVNSASQPIFSYTCDTPTAAQPQPKPCSLAGVDNIPANIRDVAITLIVATPLPDATTGLPRIVQLSGRGRRVNPNQ
jgi:prepilin-type N-terminal cleavage/methylation domain-containing protein